jgi:radical SAM superfamily enzyme YgiQ (UPF0313 family)
MKKKILLINPWIYDFKAYDFWMKPLGLLYVASILREARFEINYLDLLDRYHSMILKRVSKMPQVDEYGRGKFYSEEIFKPTIYTHFPRRYKRYGMPPSIFQEILATMEKPDWIFITSIMSYWYPAVFDVIKIVKEHYPDIPIVLGGIYATLCSEHAQRFSGADIIISGRAETNLQNIFPNFKPIPFSSLPYPAFDLYTKLDYAIILTSQGCPFSCSYCAVPNLSPKFVSRDANSVIKEIEHLQDLGIKNIAFYDDALLANPHFSAILDETIARKMKLNFHSPNGLHSRFLTQNIADKMFEAGFKTIYLSLESTDPEVHRLIDEKVTTNEFESAVKYLLQSGFSQSQIHAYLMIGMSEISVRTIKNSIDFLTSYDITPHLAEFSPIPNTKGFDRVGFSKETDPLLHNNTIFPALNEKQRDELNEIKAYLSRLRLTV